MMFQQLPTAGLPFQFERWEEFEAFASDQLTTGVIDDLSEIRWDLRPAMKHGTLENRICDGVSTLDDMQALVALMHCLVIWLDERVAAGETLTTMPPWHVQENKWRAARYGVDAIVILDADSNERLVTDDLADLVPRLMPTAERLGCAGELATVLEIAARGPSYARQRAVAERTSGDLVALVDSVVTELKASL
jgi:carboxylate-amine ligase